MDNKELSKVEAEGKMPNVEAQMSKWLMSNDKGTPARPLLAVIGLVFAFRGLLSSVSGLVFAAIGPRSSILIFGKKGTILLPQGIDGIEECVHNFRIELGIDLSSYDINRLIDSEPLME